MRFAVAAASSLVGVLLAATSASAFGFRMTPRTPTEGVDPGDLVVVDVFFDADRPGIRVLSLGVLSSSASALAYDPSATAALPIIHPAPAPIYGTTGAQPGYILYDPGTQVGMSGRRATVLYPVQTPSWLTWPAPPVGGEQININYLEWDFVDPIGTFATGTNIWIGSLAFRVVTLNFLQAATLSLSLTAGGNILYVDDAEVDPATVPLSSPIWITFGEIPEPATFTLVSLGLVGIAFHRRRRSWQGAPPGAASGLIAGGPMRFVVAGALAMVGLLLGAANASAFGFRMEARTPTSELIIGDEVVVDVFFDADQPGLSFVSVAVLSSSAHSIRYDQDASAALPILHPAPAPAYGTTGAQPGYILYDPGTGTGMSGRPATVLYPLQTPSWLNWPAPPVGQEQVNLNYVEMNPTDVFDTIATGANIWIGSLAFRVRSYSNVYESLSLSLTAGGAGLFVGDSAVDPQTVSLSAPIVLQYGPIPEPDTLTLACLGFAGIGLWRRGRSRK